MIYNYKLAIVFTVFCNIAYLTYDVSITYIDNRSSIESRMDLNLYNEYIIDTPGCRIEYLDAFSEEIKDYVYKINSITCRNRGLLTYILRDDNVVTLNINSSLVNEYSAFSMTCCYSTIKRNPVGPNPDDNLIFSDCIAFNDSVKITENFVKVECSNFYRKVYENVHTTLQSPKEISPIKEAPNILLIGIDGVSRSNLIRTMPKTFEFCERNEWVNLKGYNKIDDNTFPNLMAVLAGMDFPQAEKYCNPYVKYKLDNCSNFIWRRYKEYGYSTAYAEDTPSIATFNGIKVGFKDPPTDYYFRPYFLAADQLSAKYLCLKAHCTGPEKTGIRMQESIKDFLDAIKDKTPGFGLFWMNTFSHENVNCPSSMDEDFLRFFEEMQGGGYFDNTVVVFFSDHGFRFGKIRLTHTGWLEERLPFIYIWLPKKFRLENPVEYKNLLENSEKLTTPYDLHMTLQHLLSLSDDKFTESRSQGCPNCLSLLRPISSMRNCNQSGIPQHYCTCSRYEKLHKNAPLAQEAAQFFVTKLNDIISSYGDESKGCSTYFLHKINHAKSLVLKEGVEENILVGVMTNPEAIFEATIKIVHDSKYGNKTLSLIETNRLDRYAPKTFCVSNSTVQMYCYCKSLLKRVTNIFCNIKFCFLYVWPFYFVQSFTLSFYLVILPCLLHLLLVQNVLYSPSIPKVAIGCAYKETAYRKIQCFRVAASISD